MTLITGGTATDVPWTSRTPAAKRVRRIFPDPAWMTPDPTLKAGDHITLALFDDAVLDAGISNVTRYPNGAVGLTAHLQGGRNGTVYLSYCDGQMRASVQVIGDADFCVKYNPATGAHYAVEVDRENSIVLEGADPLTPPANDAAADATPKSVAAEPVALADAPAGSTVVDVMIVYTPAALAYEGNVANMNNNIASAMQKANEVHTNSNTQVYLNLVHSAEVTYTEVHYTNDLNNLTYSGGAYSAMDEVQTLRNQYGVDLICLFENEPGTGGVGWLLNDINGEPNWAFCLARVQQSDSTYTVVHEWGHNMGCHHHKQQNYQPGPTVWNNWSANTWSAGWRWTGMNGAKYCSVMTYEGGSYFPDGQWSTRVPYFSNPAITNNGVSVGDAAGGDNARTIRAMKTVLAGYRAALVWMLTFDVQGGTAANPASKIVTNGSTYGTLATTARTGYAFDGWWTGANGTGSQVTSSTMVSSAATQTLYAKWIANAYAVTFDAQGGAVSPASINVTYDSTYGTLPIPTRLGYTFDGWWTGTDGTGSQVLSETTVTITSDQTLYAKWTVSFYTLTINNGTGGGSYTNGQQVAITAADFSPWMAFDQWSGDTAYVNNITYTNAMVTMPAQDIALTANYTALLYTLTVNNGTGSGVYWATTEVSIMANPPPEGLIFDQWIGDAGALSSNTASTTVTMPEFDTAVTATYKSPAVLLTAAAGANGMISPPSTNVTPGNNATFTITATNYYRISTLTTNGTAVTGISFDNTSTFTNFIWSNVQAAGTVTVDFVAQVVTNPVAAPAPYSWMAGYGLTNYEADAVLDPDSDGMKTWTEYIAGTDPTNRASSFRVNTFKKQANGVVIQWSPVTGRVYGVHWTTNLKSSFQSLGTNIVWPQGSYTDTVHGAESRSFYKVKVQLAP